MSLDSLPSGSASPMPWYLSDLSEMCPVGHWDLSHLIYECLRFFIWFGHKIACTISQTTFYILLQNTVKGENCLCCHDALYSLVLLKTYTFEICYRTFWKYVQRKVICNFITQSDTVVEMSIYLFPYWFSMHIYIDT